MSTIGQQTHDMIVRMARQNTSLWCGVDFGVFCIQLIEANDPAIIQMFLDGASDALVPLSGGRKAVDQLLAQACFQGQLDMIKQILPYAEIDGDGNWAMAQAVARGDEHIIDVLLAHGFSLTAPEVYQSPLFESVKHKNAAIAQFLIGRGADINEHHATTMWSAVLSQDPVMMELFAEGDWGKCVEISMETSCGNSKEQKRARAILKAALSSSSLSHSHRQRDEQPFWGAATVPHSSYNFDRLLLDMVGRDDDWMIDEVARRCGTHSLNMALMWAAEIGATTMLQALTRHADPKHNDSQALNKAVLYQNLKSARILLPFSDASARQSMCLSNALRNNDRPMIELLWEHSDVAACQQQLIYFDDIMSQLGINMGGNDLDRKDQQALELLQQIKAEKERKSMQQALQGLDGLARAASKL